MKTKSAIVHAALNLCLSYAVLGQASFALRNIDTSQGVDAPVFDAEGRLLAGAVYRAELYGGPAAESLAPLMVLDSQTRLIVPLRTPGYFYSNESSLSVPNVPPNGWAWLQLRVWDASLGSTYEEVIARQLGSYGESPVFFAQGRDPTRIPPDIPAPLIGLQSFSLRPVPEPSTWALLGLGGLAGGWALRRQRKST